MVHGFYSVPPHIAARIEIVTSGKVTMTQLRPELFTIAGMRRRRRELLDDANLTVR
jgi:DNA-binding transcriptional regulator YdaS (Cro superfamily)